MIVQFPCCVGGGSIGRLVQSFIFAVASDSDCDPRGAFLDTARDRYLFRLGLRLASDVVAQTASQCGLLRRGFGIEARRAW